MIDSDLNNLLAYIKKLKPLPEQELESKFVEFGDLERHKTLIWDMDETLIHSTMIMPGQEGLHAHDFIIELPNGGKFAVSIRPYVFKVLDHLGEMWEMAVFTAGERTYADLILDKLDPEKKYFKARLYREHCVKAEDNVYVKDLRIIRDRELEDIVIVDNSILSFAF